MVRQLLSVAHLFEFRTIVRDGDPWFVAKDVCDVLGLSNVTMALGHLDDDEKGLSTVDTPGGDPWFVAKDVCDVLGLSDPAQSLRYLDDDEKDKINTAGTSLFSGQGTPVTSVINEPGLYSLILRSRKERAKEFKRWITHEALSLANVSDALKHLDADEKGHCTVGTPGGDQRVSIINESGQTPCGSSGALPAEAR